MKERGVIISGDMVRAILDGSKTQLRRVIRPTIRSADSSFELHQQADASWLPLHTFNESSFDKSGYERPIKCPLGQPGDRLWVREAFRVHSRASDVATLVYRASTRQSWTQATHRVPVALCDRPAEVEKWTGSNHMPRWASRITLEITRVRVERLQDISEADAVAEGVPPAADLLPDHPGTFLTPKGDFASAAVAFQRLWESIYGNDSWQANPWVWVVEFKRVEVQL